MVSGAVALALAPKPSAGGGGGAASGLTINDADTAYLMDADTAPEGFSKQDYRSQHKPNTAGFESSGILFTLHGRYQWWTDSNTGKQAFRFRMSVLPDAQYNEWFDSATGAKAQTWAYEVTTVYM